MQRTHQPKMPNQRNTLAPLAALSVLLALPAAQAQVQLGAQLEMDGVFSNAVDASLTNAREGETRLGGGVDVTLQAPVQGWGVVDFVGAGLRLPLNKASSDGPNDLWLQVGNAQVDVKLGRFEGMNLFPLGQDIALEPVAGYRPYLLNRLRGPVGNGSRHIALGLNSSFGLRWELGWVSSSYTGQFEGLRAGVNYQSGPLRLRAGLESAQEVGSSIQSTGMGFSVGYELEEGIGFNASFASINKDSSVGFNAQFGALGLGWLSVIDDRTLGKSNAFYGGYTIPLNQLRGATLTPALSMASGNETTGRQMAARVRLQYPLR